MEISNEVQLERELIGKLLYESKWVPFVSSELKIESFTVASHKYIYQAILKTYDKYGYSDPVLAYQMIVDIGQANRVGGATEIYDMMAQTIESDSVPHYVSEIKSKWVRRRFQLLGSYIQQVSTVQDKEIYEISESIYKELSQIHHQTVQYTHYGPEILDEIAKDIEDPSRNIGMATGYIELDLLTGGFHNGELIIVAALPSMGKTVCINNFNLNIVLIHESPVMLFSLEMPFKLSMNRMLSAESRIPHEYLKRGMITDMKRFKAAFDRLYTPRFIINDQAGISLSQIRNEVRKHKYGSNLALVIIDYLQLVTTPRQETIEAELSTIVKGLKSMARDNDIPVIAVSQLNRATTSTLSKRPELHNIRGSGAIEAEADVVIFLHRDDYFNEGESDGTIDVMVKKNRNGPVGTFKLGYEKEIMRFSNIL